MKKKKNVFCLHHFMAICLVILRYSEQKSNENGQDRAKIRSHFFLFKFKQIPIFMSCMKVGERLNCESYIFHDIMHGGYIFKVLLSFKKF